MHEERPRVVVQQRVEDDLDLAGHDERGPPGLRVQRLEAGRGLAVLADPAAAVGLGRVVPVELVDLRGHGGDVIPHVDRVPRDAEGRADITHVRLARGVQGDPLDAVGTHRRVQVGVVHRLLGQHRQPRVLAGGHHPGLGGDPVLLGPGEVLAGSGC